MRHRNSFLLTTIFALTLICISGACFSAGPELTAVSIDTPPVIDGKLDDACWQQAVQVSDFWVSNQNLPPSEKTIAYIAVDSKCVYAAFRCLDSQPSGVRGLQTKRDGSFVGDDYVRLDLDTYHNHQTTSWFAITAGGAQKDGIVGGTASKVDWKGDWSAISRIDEQGWCAEMAIPYSILRYDPSATSFGVSFCRYHQRTTERPRWPHILDDTRMVDFGDLVGLALPKSRSSLKPVFLAYSIAAAESALGLDNRSGMDIKYPLGSSSTAVLSLNPDFESVEQEVESVDFSYVERHYQDYRPFFREGNENFSNYNAGVTLFYSRRIPDFDNGLKYIGKLGTCNLSLLNTRGQGRTDTIGHVRFDIGRTSGVGTYFLDASRPGIGNVVSATEAFTKRGNYTFGTLLGLSNSSGMQGDGSFGVFYGKYDTPKFSIDLDWVRIGRNFTVLDGYVPYTDIHGPSLGLDFNRSYRDKSLRRRGFSAQYTGFTNSSGLAVMKGLKVGADFEWSSDIEAWFAAERTDRSANDPGDTTVYRDMIYSADVRFDCRSLYTGYGCGLAWGRQKDHRYAIFEPYWNLQPAKNLNMQIGATIVSHIESYTQAVLSAAYDFSPERGIGFRLVTLGGENNFFASYRHAVRRGMDLYLIYGDPNSDSTVNRLAAKVVYPLTF